MVQCWQKSPGSRPTFDAISTTLRDIVDNEKFAQKQELENGPLHGFSRL